MSTIFHGDVAITGGNTKAIVSFASNKKADAKVTEVLIYTDDTISGKVAAWGLNNDFPQVINRKIKGAGSLRSGLRTNRKAHYGSGFILAKESHENGKRLIEQVCLHKHPEINAFFKRSQMKRVFKETIADLEHWALACPEYILSKDFKTITRVKRQQTANCRYELMDETTRSIKHMYISTRWPDSPSLDSKYVSKVKLIDSYWSAEEVKEYCKKHKIRNFIRPAFYPLINENYYPDPEWHSIEYSGWLDIINAIPKYKKAFLEDKINVNFHIEVFEEYFQRKYKEDWESFTPEKRKQIQSDFVEELDSSLRGVENGGKSVMSIIYKDDNGTPQPGLKITEIKKGESDGAYLDDTSAGVQAALTASGTDPSLIGAGIPGSALGAGSGSDKRVAWEILSALKNPDRDTTLEIFEFIQEYNGWDDTLIGGFENTQITTLDVNPTGTEKSASL